MQPRTRRQKDIFDYIISFIARQGYEPSYQQIAKFFRIKSKAAIAKHIAALESQGLLSRRTADGKFSLHILPERDMTTAICEIPYLEELSETILEEPQMHGKTMFMPKFMLGNLLPETIFAFRVPNDAMKEEQICEGDIALFERRFYARSGELVLALVENRRSVVKRFYDFGAQVQLKPANSEFQMLQLAAQDVVIGGVFRALLRPAN